MKTKTAKTANLSEEARKVYNNCYTAEGEKEITKIRKLAAKMDISFEDALMAVLVKKIQYGAIKLGRHWYPVVGGEVQPYSYTFSTGAMSDTVHIAGQRGVAVKV